MNTTDTAAKLSLKLAPIKDDQGAPVYSAQDCADFAVQIDKIQKLKKEKNAVILAHVYVRPEIIFGIGDYVGDSYFLSKKAVETQADTIVFCGVRFMAETAKILNPTKTVLLTAPESGCTLADCIDEDQLLELRNKYKSHTFVCYINTPAVVKAHCHVCVTSANAPDIIESLENDKIFFLTDRLMAQNVRNAFARKGIKKEILNFDGCCYVHEQYTKEMLDKMRAEHPDAFTMCHPECREEVVDGCDFSGSTSQIESAIKASDRKKFFILSATGIIQKLQSDYPDKEFIGTSFDCKYMRSNTLEEVVRVLENPAAGDIVTLDEEISKKARKCIDAMFFYAEKANAK